MKKTTIIAIDGYSSCGKSTLAKALAKKLDFIYVDSGAMYRAVALYFINENINLLQTTAITNALNTINIDFVTHNHQIKVLLNEVDVSEEIRQMPVSQMVSNIATISLVRQAMVKLQQKMGEQKNLVMDGRDIGTTVFPDAQLKLFMTADPKIRAERRFNELKIKDENVSYEDIFANLAHRDLMDTTRKISPLVKANDAVILDNTHLNQQQQLEFAIALLRK